MENFSKNGNFENIKNAKRNNVDLVELEILEDMFVSLLNSEFSDCFLLHGGFALSCLLRSRNLAEFERPTRDLDFDWKDRKTWDIFTENCEELFSRNSAKGFAYKKITTRNINKNPNGGGIFFECRTNSGVYKVNIDMNIKTFGESASNITPFLKISFDSASVYAMLCDKLQVFSQKIIKRRIKDFYDIYAYSFLDEYIIDKIGSIWLSSGYILGEVIEGLSPSAIPELEHAFTVYTGFPIELDFKRVYARVQDFTVPIYAYLSGENNAVNANKWNIDKGAWI